MALNRVSSSAIFSTNRRNWYHATGLTAQSKQPVLHLLQATVGNLRRGRGNCPAGFTGFDDCPPRRRPHHPAPHRPPERPAQPTQTPLKAFSTPPSPCRAFVAQIGGDFLGIHQQAALAGQLVFFALALTHAVRQLRQKLSVGTGFRQFGAIGGQRLTRCLTHRIKLTHGHASVRPHSCRAARVSCGIGQCFILAMNFDKPPICANRLTPTGWSFKKRGCAIG